LIEEFIKSFYICHLFKNRKHELKTFSLSYAYYFYKEEMATL